MATATAIPTKHEIDGIEAELSTLRGKLATEQSVLEALGRERSQLGERIALGQEKPAKAADLARRTEIQQAAVEGLQAAIARKNARLAELYPSLRRIEEETRLAVLRAEVSRLEAQGVEVAKRINAKIAEILAVDFPEYDTVRLALMNQQEPSLAMQVRGALTTMGGEIFDQSVPKAAADLLAQGWRVRGDIVFTCKNLMPPK